MTDEVPAEEKRNSPDWATILAVVIVLGGVAYVLFYDLRWGRGGSKEATERLRTNIVVKETKLACGNFKLEFEKYPWDGKDSAGGEIDPEQVYAELSGRGTINRRYNYMKKLSKDSVKNGRIVDLWGNELLFRVDPATGDAVIWSCGPDGTDDTNDGASSDPAKKPKTRWWFGKGDTGDDVGNWPGKTPASFAEWEKQMERSQGKGGAKVE